MRGVHLLRGIAAVTFLLLACRHRPGGIPPRPVSIHRSASSACGASAIVGQSDPALEGCRSDGECAAGKGGRCIGALVGPHHRTNICVYDDCYSDIDCGAAGVCECGSGRAHSNECLRGNCRLDADCGAQGRCSPSMAEGGVMRCNGAAAYYCLFVLTLPVSIIAAGITYLGGILLFGPNLDGVVARATILAVWLGLVTAQMLVARALFRISRRKPSSP